MSIIFIIFIESFSQKTSTLVGADVTAKTERKPLIDSTSLMLAQQCNCFPKILDVGDQVVLLNVKHRHSRYPPLRLDVDVGDIQPHPIKNKFGRVVFDIVTSLFD